MNSTHVTGPRYLVQLPVTADDLATAVRIARVVARSLSLHSLVACEATTVVAVDQPALWHPVFCRQPLAHGRRCLLRPDHDGPCNRWLAR